MTTITATRTDTLSPGTFFTFKGRSFEILKRNPSNYLAVRDDGVKYNIPRGFPITVKTDAVPSTSAVSTQAYLEGLPQFGLGVQVKINGNPSSKLYGTVGLICKVNPTTYHVVVKNLGVIAVSHRGVVKHDD